MQCLGRRRRRAEVRSFSDRIHLTVLLAKAFGVVELGGWGSLELGHHGGEDFLNSNRGCCALIVPAFVKEFLKERRNDLFLNSVVVNLPWARAGEKGNAGCRSSSRNVHRQTVFAHQPATV